MFVGHRWVWPVAAILLHYLVLSYYFYVKKGIAESKLLLTYIIILAFLNLRVHVKVSLLCCGYVVSGWVRKFIRWSLFGGGCGKRLPPNMTMWVTMAEVVNFGNFYCILCAVKSYWTFWELPESLLLQLFRLLNIERPWILFGWI